MLSVPLISRFPSGNQNSLISRARSSEDNTFPYCFFLCSFSFGKLLANVGVLITDKNQYPELRIWIILSTICDFVNIMLLIIETLNIMRLYTQANNIGSLDEESLENRHVVEDISKNKIFKTTLILNNCYYYILWGVGHYLYFKSCEDCTQSLHVIVNIMFLYLYCGYFYVGCSLLMAILSKSLMSLFTSSSAGLASRARDTWDALNKLPVKLYSSDMVTSECHICLVNYNEGDKITELPCNTKHYFHETCVKKWLKLNNACPLCRKPIEGLSTSSTMNEIELPPMF